MNNNPLSFTDPSGFDPMTENYENDDVDSFVPDVWAAAGEDRPQIVVTAARSGGGGVGVLQMSSGRGSGPASDKGNRSADGKPQGTPNKSVVCAQAAAAMQAFNAATGQPTQIGNSNPLDAASTALGVADATAQAAQANPGAIGAVARSPAPYIGPVGNAVDATAAVQDLQGGDLNSAAARATDVYVTFNLLRIPDVGPLLAGVYTLAGGIKTGVNSVLQLANNYQLAQDALRLGNQCLSSGGHF